MMNFFHWQKTMAVCNSNQIRSIDTIGPSLWNDLPQYLWLTLLSWSLPAFFSLIKTLFYSRGLHTFSATEWSLLWAALYNLRNTILYKTIVTCCVLDCYLLSRISLQGKINLTSVGLFLTLKRYRKCKLYFWNLGCVCTGVCLHGTLSAGIWDSEEEDKPPSLICRD